MMSTVYKKSNKFIALALVFLLSAAPAFAGITVTGADGITVTGADGITYVNTSGITVTGADGILSFGVNGISVDGITVTGADGSPTAGANGITYTGADSVYATTPDGITVTGADGITVTGADGITVTGADGTRYQADSVTVRQPNGITVTGADGANIVGTNGLNRTGSDGITVTGADGITVTGADGITVTGADGITVTGADGQVISVSPQGITVTGADLAAITKANGITVTGADGITVTGADGGVSLPLNVAPRGIRSLDPELADLLNRSTDDSNINAVIVYHQATTEADLADLRNFGVLGGTRYEALPMIAVTATRRQLINISHLQNVRSIYGNRTLQSTLDSNLSMTQADNVRRDSDLTTHNANMPVTGRNVTVAVLDTGLDGTHPDLLNRVAQNVKLADAQSASVGFNPPVEVENLPNTDQLYGHGTFVAGLIGGTGARSGGKYAGVAPGARLVGLSAGDLNLSYVLAGFDYLMARGAGLNVRVVNCSFSADTVFDFNDPVNVATRMLTDAGVNVVFSAGNTGPGAHSLNPYAVAPWVVSVGATDASGHLASFSSRGDFGSRLFRPTVVAPGVGVISLRSASSPNVTGANGLAGGDTQRLAPSELPFYTTASGTSFSAPQVAGAIALMLEERPNLKPADVRDILQRTATPLAGYYDFEVGAGMLNSYAAVLESAFPQRRMGLFRATIDRGQAVYTNDSLQQFNGSVLPGANTDATFYVPANTVLASIQTAWGPLASANDLSITLTDSRGLPGGTSDTPNRAGLMGKRERATLKMPIEGAWRVRVRSAQGLLYSLQPFVGVTQVTRVQYAPVNDLGGLGSTAQFEIYQALRSFVMTSSGNHFRPSAAVTRADLAQALVAGARVPQYLPGQPTYTDVRDASRLIFVESAQAAPTGPLFTDAVAGGQFRPDATVDRLTAAIALVRAAGFRAEAEAQAGTPLTYTDASAIPYELRGYVAVAIAHGLLTANGAAFNPQGALTRTDLAHAMATIMRAATQ